MKTTWKILACVTLFAATGYALDRKIPVTDLPLEVTDAILHTYPTATLLSAEADTKLDGQIENYEVSINDNGKKRKLKLSPSGEFQKQGLGF